MKTILIKADQTVFVREIEEFDELVKHFDGFPEFVYPRRLKSTFCLVIDDMGLRKNLPCNDLCSYLYESDKHGNIIAGDAFLMKKEVSDDGSYDIIGLNDREVFWLLNTYNLQVSKNDSQEDENV